jgi:hypothetical protein
MSEESTNKPLVSLSIGPYFAGLWENTVNAGDGTQAIVKAVSLRKGFFNKKANKLDHQTISIKPHELGSVIALLQQMHNSVIENRTPAF